MLLALVTVGTAIAIGYARGGRLRNLSDIRLRGVWTLVVAVTAQVGIVALRLWEDASPALGRGLLMVSLVAVAGFVLANHRLPGMWLALIGFALNAAVIVPNGAMPVSAEAIAFLEGEEAIEPGKHRILEESDVLPWLADVIPVPGLRVVVSVGDIALALGIAVLVNRAMFGPIGRHSAAYVMREASGPP